MNRSLEILFDKCSAFKKMHAIISHKERGNSFQSHSYLYAVLYNFIKDNETSNLITHNYLREYHPDYDEETTNYQISKIIEKELKPVFCKTLQKDGYCKKQCANIGEAKSPISLLYKAQNVPLLFIGQDIRGLLQFFKQHKLNGSDTRVAMCLISYKNPENNVVFPSNETMASDTGLSEKTVKNSIKRLVTKKLITKSLQRRKGNYPFNKYTLSQELLDGYKPKVGEHFSKHKLEVKLTPSLETNTGRALKT